MTKVSNIRQIQANIQTLPASKLKAIYPDLWHEVEKGTINDILTISPDKVILSYFRNQRFIHSLANLAALRACQAIHKRLMYSKAIYGT